MKLDPIPRAARRTVLRARDGLRRRLRVVVLRLFRLAIAFTFRLGAARLVVRLRLVVFFVVRFFVLRFFGFTTKTSLMFLTFDTSPCYPDVTTG